MKIVSFFTRLVILIAVVGVVLWGLGSGFPVIPPAAPVGSESLTPKYLASLGGALVGIENGAAVSMGIRACSAFSEKSTATDIRGVLMAKGLTAAQANRVVLAAVTAYCPQYADMAMG